MFQFLMESAGSGTTGGNIGGTILQIGLIVLVVVAFYFFLIRPQKKQEKETNAMRNALEIGDEITTIGGIIGQIVSIKGETITIVTSKNKTKIRFLKSAVRSVEVKANAAKAESAEESAEVEAVPEKTENSDNSTTGAQ